VEVAVADVADERAFQGRGLEVRLGREHGLGEPEIGTHTSVVQPFDPGRSARAA
jgi:hypothetical protein